MKTRAWLVGLAAHAAMAGALAQGAPAAYPSKPVKIIVAYSPGGSNDILARLLARRMQEDLGQVVTVENRPSNGGVVGALSVAKAAPDGYTLMVGATGQFAFNAAVMKNLPYSPRTDFVPVSLMATFPLVVSVKAASPIHSIKDLVQYTQANPEKSNYGASTSSFQLVSELIKEQTGMRGEYVPYKGSMESINAVASGEVTYTVVDTGPVAGAIKGNLLRGLAMTSSRRIAAFPDIPTLKEQGIDQEVELWVGLFAPAGTPSAIVQVLERETAKAVAHPESVKVMEQVGMTPASSSSAAFTRQVGEEIDFWSALARKKNISIE
jgi:tripartite-type tricarboxylate transporter receptor subunit TctC